LQDFHDDALSDIIEGEKDISHLLTYFEINNINSIGNTEYDIQVIRQEMLPIERLIDLANRLPALFRLDLIRGRVEAIEMIFDLIDNIKNNFLLEMHRVNDELMVNCELNLDD